MFHSEKEFLYLYGWDGFFESQCPDQVSVSIVPARVICEERNLYRVQFGFKKSLWASVTGKLQFKASSVSRGYRGVSPRAEFPAVGDWVLLEIPSQGDRGVIHQVLPRKSIIERKQVGSSIDSQILSTNVDYIFITTSMSDELNFRRIERYLAVVWESGALPVIVLTKADIYLGNFSDLIVKVQGQFPGVDVQAISKNDFSGAQFLPQYLQPGKTAVVVGSSGVGKSTLVNFLVNGSAIKTQSVREYDGKGRHTTTSRSLYQSRFGGLIIDTPGMRELQLLDHTVGVETQFADIESLLGQCRFSDCQHVTEPDCAIKAALSDESLSSERWESYRRLMAEVSHGLRRRDKVLAAEDRKRWKKISLQARSGRRNKIGGM